MMKLQRFKWLTGVSVSMLILLVDIGYAAASDRGEQLYNNHCQDCHDKSVHTRTERRVESIESLRVWVVAWSVHNGLYWGNEEVADISDYLNRTIYHFTD